MRHYFEYKEGKSSKLSPKKKPVKKKMSPKKKSVKKKMSPKKKSVKKKPVKKKPVKKKPVKKSPKKKKMSPAKNCKNPKGFTQIASCKAHGKIARTGGKYKGQKVKSKKYGGVA